MKNSDDGDDEDDNDDGDDEDDDDDDCGRDSAGEVNINKAP